MIKAASLCLSGLERIAFHLVRGAERILARPILSLLLWPAAFLWGLADAEKQQNALASWRRLVDFAPALSLPAARAWHAAGAAHARFVYLFPDRLPERRWLRRCRVTGSQTVAELRDSPRRIVFASLHFGPFETLPYWLRALGLPVTTLVGRPAPRQALKQRQYALSPPAGLPVVLPVTEKGQIRDAVENVQHLLIFMDVARGRQVELALHDHVFRLATGAIRIAAAIEADLIPCLTTVAPGWRFTIHLGAPVPRALLTPVPDLAGAASHLLGEFLPIVRQHPAQCGYRFLASICEEEHAATDLVRS